MDNSTSKKPLRREWSGHPTLNDIPRPIERVEAEVAAFQQAMSAGAALARICNPAMPLPVQPGSSSFDCPMARQVVSALRCLWDARTSRTDPQHSQSHYVPLRPLHPRPSHTPDDVPQITVHAAEQSARATSLKRQYKSLNGMLNSPSLPSFRPCCLRSFPSTTFSQQRRRLVFLLRRFVTDQLTSSRDCVEA